MKSVKIALVTILILGMLAISLAACDWDDNARHSTKSTPQPANFLAGELTATYGADQFFTQLTAIAVDQLRGAGQQANGAGSAP